MTVSPEARAGARHLILQCGSATRDDTIALVFDAETASPAACVAEAAEALGLRVEQVPTPSAAAHGEEPPAAVADAMRWSSLILGLRAKSMAHTRARLDASAAGARYLSLPDYSMELLADPCLRIDYRSVYPAVRDLTEVLTRGSRIHVTTALGTDLTAAIDGRRANCCPGFVDSPGSLGSPPDVESNIAPLEQHSHGVIVVDGSIPFPGFGLLADPITLTVADGAIVEVEGPRQQADALSALLDAYGPVKSRILAECGFGLNPLARLTGVMLTDEGTSETLHFGFGSNSTVGGVNDVSFHLDCVLRRPTVTVDGRPVLDQGRLAL